MNSIISDKKREKCLKEEYFKTAKDHNGNPPKFAYISCPCKKCTPSF